MPARRAEAHGRPQERVLLRPDGQRHHLVADRRRGADRRRRGHHATHKQHGAVPRRPTGTFSWRGPRPTASWCFTNDDKVAVKAPAASGAAAVTLQFGATLLELDAEIDARLQFAGVKGDQLGSGAAERGDQRRRQPRASPAPGNLSSDDLAAVVGAARRRPAARRARRSRSAGLGRRRVAAPEVEQGERPRQVRGHRHHATPATSSALGRRRRSLQRQRVRHRRAPRLRPGARLENALAVRRRRPDRTRGRRSLGAGGGTPAARGARACRSASSPATRTPTASTAFACGCRWWTTRTTASGRACASLDAGDDRGFFFRPEIGDEVVVGFLDDDPRRAVILGMLHSSAKAAPLAGSDDNHEKVYQSRSKMKLSLQRRQEGRHARDAGRQQHHAQRGGQGDGASPIRTATRSR